MENPELNEFYNGLHSAEKMARLREGLEAIAVKNAAYFEGRNSAASTDALSDHYVLLQNSDRIVFGFIENTDIPDAIKSDCIELFNGIFNEDAANLI